MTILCVPFILPSHFLRGSVPSVWHMCTFRGSAEGKHSPAFAKIVADITAQLRTPIVASKARNPAPAAHRRTPDGCLADGLHCATMTEPDDFHLCLPNFIRPIQALIQNVDFCYRQEKGVMGYLGTVSGRSYGPTKSDIVLPALLWDPPVRFRLANPHRCQPHIRHGHLRCGPLLTRLDCIMLIGVTLS